jgi:hypothetical protein
MVKGGWNEEVKLAIQILLRGNLSYPTEQHGKEIEEEESISEN